MNAVIPWDKAEGQRVPKKIKRYPHTAPAMAMRAKKYSAGLTGRNVKI
jgi:hypothetical protein